MSTRRFLSIAFLVLLAPIAFGGETEPEAQLVVALRRLSIPAAADVAAAQKKIREIFRDEYAKPAAALPEKFMLQSAGEADPAARYALLREAVELAVRMPSAELAQRAVDTLGQVFELDVFEETLAFAARIAIIKLDGMQACILVREFERGAKRALDAGDYGKLPKISAAGRNLARRLPEKNSAAAIQSWCDDLDSIAAAGKALDALAAAPDDPAANLAAGSLFLFYRGDADRGLPALAKSSDEKLKSVALREMARPQEPASMVALGEEWAAAAVQQRETFKYDCLQRALFWLQKAQPQLSGVEQMRVEKRLVELAAAADAKKSARPLAGKLPVLVDLAACVDDRAEVYLNGRLVFQMDLFAPTTAKIVVQRGDVLTAKVTDTGGDHAFVCAVKSHFSSQYSADKLRWSTYTPSNPAEWWLVPSGSPARGVGTGHTNGEVANVLEKKIGVRAPSMWPQGLGEKSTGYLFAIVGDELLK